MSEPPQDYLEIHASLAEELRHSDGLVWQLALAIAALEEGVVALSDQGGFQNSAGRAALAFGFLLSVFLSFVLLRHAYDRRATVRRMSIVEGALAAAYPKIFARGRGSPQWGAAMLLAWFLLVESSVGFVLFARLLLAKPTF